ncbi:MAG: CDP-alcohol phosphatidyltransferase family protein [Hyphomonadaceae bacterium]
MSSTLPTQLTLARLAAGPIVAGLILWGDAQVFTAGAAAARWPFAIALALFALAALSDALDGWLARKLAAATPLGAALDHAADKALTAAVLLALAVTALATDLVALAVLILARDAAVAGLREGLALSGRAMPVSVAGKWKTALLLLGIGAALAMQTLVYFTAPIEAVNAANILARAALWAGAALAVWSGWRYFATAFAPPKTEN